MQNIAPTSEDLQAFVKAAENGDIRTVGEFIAHYPAAIDIPDPVVGWTALMWAARTGQQETASMLLEKGADLHLKSAPAGWTPLIMTAIWSGHTGTMELLLKNGARIDEKNFAGMTALMCAAQKGFQAAVILLLENGASTEIKDNYNRTAADWARSDGGPAMMTLLKTWPEIKKARLEDEFNSFSPALTRSLAVPQKLRSRRMKP